MAEDETSHARGRPTVSAIYARHKQGGGLWSAHVSNRLAACIVVMANRQGWTPNALSLANLAIGTGSGIFVIALHHDRGLCAIVAFIGWQVAYALDCADGQLARHLEAGSSAGALVDVLCDYLVQSVLTAAVFVVIAPHFAASTIALAGPLVATGLLLALFDTTVAVQVARIRPSGGRSTALTIIKRTVRDYGLTVAVIPLLIWLSPEGLLAFTAAEATLNALAVTKRIADAVRTPPAATT